MELLEGFSSLQQVLFGDSVLARCSVEQEARAKKEEGPRPSCFSLVACVCKGLECQGQGVAAEATEEAGHCL